MSKNKKMKFNYDDDFFDYNELNYAFNKKRQDRDRKEKRKQKYSVYEIQNEVLNNEEE